MVGGLHPALGSWLSKPMHSQKTSSTTQRTLSPLSRPNLFWGTFKNVHVNSSTRGQLCGPSVKVGNQHSAGLSAWGPQFTSNISHSIWVTPRRLRAQLHHINSSGWEWKREWSTSSPCMTLKSIQGDWKYQFQRGLLVANTAGGKMNLGALEKGPMAPVAAFSRLEARVKILALSRDF